MNTYFSLSESIYDITSRWPELLDFLAANGFENMKNPVMRNSIGKRLSMEAALKSKNLDAEAFEKQMVEVLESKAVLWEESGYRYAEENAQKAKTGDFGEDRKGAAEKTAKEIKMEGAVPCPIRFPLIDMLEEWKEKTQTEIKFDLKAASMGTGWIREKMEKCKSPEEIADIYLSAGFETFFDNSFLGDYKDQGIFQEIEPPFHRNSIFENERISVKDPKGQYTILGGVPAVFAVNTTYLGERKLPETWEDLMKPEFENSLALPVQDLDMFHAILLGIYAAYGKDGIRRLGAGLSSSMHPAQMVKMGKQKRTGEQPAVTVVPYFFACMMKENPSIKIVWPKDGAILSPIYLLVKADSVEKAKPFLDFLFSENAGQVLSADGKFPVIHPGEKQDLAEKNGFLWPGWEMIHSEDIPSLLKDLEQLFYSFAE